MNFAPFWESCRADRPALPVGSSGSVLRRVCAPGPASVRFPVHSRRPSGAFLRRNKRERPIALPHPPRDVPLFGRIRTAETFAAIAGVAVAVRANLDAFKIALAAVLVKAATCYATADGLFSTFAIHNLFTPPSLIESACSRQLVYPARPCLCAGGRILFVQTAFRSSRPKKYSPKGFFGREGLEFFPACGILRKIFV